MSIALLEDLQAATAGFLMSALAVSELTAPAMESGTITPS